MRKAFHKVYFTGVIIIFVLTSCSKTPEVENTATVKMAGEWFTRYYESGAAITTMHKILSYNTADPSANQVWVEDPNVWPFKAKFDVDYANFSFKAMAGATNLDIAGEKVKVFEGKVIPGGGKSKSGNVVDSIYLKVEFTDDPGTTYEIRGHQRTGFFEDEY
jgi:hypothetical protein